MQQYFNEYEKYVKDLGGMTYNQFVKERCEGPAALVVGDIFLNNKNKKFVCKIETINYAKKRCFVNFFDKNGKFSHNCVVKGSDLLDPKFFTNITDSCEIDFEIMPPTPESDILWDYAI